VLVHGADTMACRRFLVALIDGTIDEAMTKHLAEMCKAEADALPAATAGA
jgi:hypothetical protein